MKHEEEITLSDLLSVQITYIRTLTETNLSLFVGMNLTDKESRARWKSIP